MSDKQKKRRGKGEIKVKHPTSLDPSLTLDQKTDELAENRYNTFMYNLEQLLQKQGITQAQMCMRDLEGTPLPPQLTAYKNVGRDIPFRTMVRIATAYNYTVEQMCGQIFGQSQETQDSGSTLSRPVTEYNKYLGTYQMAFFNTDARLGNNRRTTARALAKGVLSVCQSELQDGSATYRVLVFSNCTDAERNALLKFTETHTLSYSELRVHYNTLACTKKGETEGFPRMKNFYEGTLHLTDRMAEITLHQVRGSDTVHIAFHNRAANSAEGSIYRGGLCTMLSMSRGEEHMPCAQAMVLSRRGFDAVADEELAQCLFLEPPKVKLQDEVASIITYMKALFPKSEGDSSLSHLSEEDKAFMLESFIERKLSEAIKHNVVAYYKVSTEMDSDIYKKICR